MEVAISKILEAACLHKARSYSKYHSHSSVFRCEAISTSAAHLVSLRQDAGRCDCGCDCKVIQERTPNLHELDLDLDSCGPRPGYKGCDNMLFGESCSSIEPSHADLPVLDILAEWLGCKSDVE